MARQIQLRRGTTTQTASFTGALGEVTVDTDKDVAVIHDGSTAGGFPLAKTSDLGTAAFTAIGDYAVASQGTAADAALPRTGGAMTGAITTNSTFDGVDIAVRDAILSSTTITAGAALPKAGGTLSGDIDGNGNKVLFANMYANLVDLPSATTYHGMFAHVHATGKGYYAHAGAWIELANEADKLNLSGGVMTGAITTNSTFDGRDVATDGTKLDGIEAAADVTDATNVTAAGALMDSEVTNLAQVKAFNTADYLAYDANLQGFVTALTLPTADGTSGQTLVTNGSGTISFATNSSGISTGKAIAMAIVFG